MPNKIATVNITALYVILLFNETVYQIYKEHFATHVPTGHIEIFIRYIAHLQNSNKVYCSHDRHCTYICRQHASGVKVNVNF